jgi:hypothetical protein
MRVALLSPVLFIAALVPACCATPAPADPTLAIPRRDLIHPANAALLAFLGEPVPWPDPVDPAFTTDGHRRAIAEATARAHAKPRHVEFDDSEFPPIVGFEVEYTVAGADANTIGAHIAKPLVWSGCTSSGWDEGGKSVARIVTALVPFEAIPPQHWSAARRRQQLRVQRLFEAMEVRDRQ